MVSEKRVEKLIREYLEKTGWTLKNTPRKTGEHGWDIETIHHKIKRKGYFIECKGDGKGRVKSQKIHNSFYMTLGQIIARMDIAGNRKYRYRVYAIGIPKGWADVFRKKTRKMKFAWNFLQLKVFLVANNGTVEEKTYRQFISKNNG